MQLTLDYAHFNHKKAGEDLYINTFVSMETQVALLLSDTKDEKLN